MGIHNKPNWHIACAGWTVVVERKKRVMCMKIECVCKPTFKEAASSINEIIKDRNVADFDMFAYGDGRCICVLFY